MNLKNILTLGSTILFILLSLFLFTRPAFSRIWDFTETGQIGDTIGGITAPIIGLIAAILVFYSFQEQVKANNIQTKALEDEKLLNASTSVFDKHLAQFTEIKNQLNNLEFVVVYSAYQDYTGAFVQPFHIIYKGINALNEYVLRIEPKAQNIPGINSQNYHIGGASLSFQFILFSIENLIESVEKQVLIMEDKRFIMNSISLFYNGFVKSFCERIIKCYAQEDPDIIELSRVKAKIEESLIK